MGKKIMAPVHPGEILMKEFLEPMGITQYRIAKDIMVPARRIMELEKDELGDKLEKEVAVFSGA